MEDEKQIVELMPTEKTIHGQNSLKLFEKYQTNSKGEVRWVEGKRCGEWVIPSDKLKQLLYGTIIRN